MHSKYLIWYKNLGSSIVIKKSLEIPSLKLCSPVEFEITDNKISLINDSENLNFIDKYDLQAKCEVFETVSMSSAFVKDYKTGTFLLTNKNIKIENPGCVIDFTFLNEDLKSFSKVDLNGNYSKRGNLDFLQVEYISGRNQRIPFEKVLKLESINFNRVIKGHVLVNGDKCEVVLSEQSMMYLKNLPIVFLTSKVKRKFDGCKCFTGDFEMIYDCKNDSSNLHRIQILVCLEGKSIPRNFFSTLGYDEKELEEDSSITNMFLEIDNMMKALSCSGTGKDYIKSVNISDSGFFESNGKDYGDKATKGIHIEDERDSGNENDFEEKMNVSNMPERDERDSGIDENSTFESSEEKIEESKDIKSNKEKTESEKKNQQNIFNKLKRISFEDGNFPKLTSEDEVWSVINSMYDDFPVANSQSTPKKCENKFLNKAVELSFCIESKNQSTPVRHCKTEGISLKSCRKDEFIPIRNENLAVNRKTDKTLENQRRLALALGFVY